MTAIVPKQFEGANLTEVLNPQQVLFQNEIAETVDAFKLYPQDSIGSVRQHLEEMDSQKVAG